MAALKEAIEALAALITTADHVQHAPTGETWLVARATSHHVYPCGWPSSRADIKDCTLVKKATADERVQLLRELAAGRSDNARWARSALDALAPSCGTCVHSDTPAAIGKAKHPCSSCTPVNPGAPGIESGPLEDCHGMVAGRVDACATAKGGA